jgi:O-antigen/teichoic acid export membrane protein
LQKTLISRNFIKSSLIYTLAGTLPMASAIILLPFYVLYLYPDTLGALSIFMAFSLLVQILTTFSFDASVYVHYHEFKNDRAKLGAFVSSSFVLMILIGACLSVILLIAAPLAFDKFFSSPLMEFFPYGVIAIVTGIFNAFFKVFSSLLQTQQRPELYLRSNLLSFSLIALFTIIGLHFYPNSLLAPLGARLAAAVISGGWSLGRVFKEFGVHFNRTLLRASFSFNFYSFIYQLQQWTINYFDRVILSFFIPLSDVGVYDVMMKCFLAIEFVVNGLYSSFFPKVVGMVVEQEIKKATPEINRYYNALTAVAMFLVSAFILLFPIAVGLFATNEKYHLAVPLIPFAALIYLFKSMRLYFTIPYGVLKYTKPLPVIYLVVTIIRIGGIIVIIPYYGLYGVIAAMLVSSWVEIALIYWKGKTRFEYRFNVFKIIIAPVTLMVIVGVLEMIWGKTYPIQIHVVQALCAGLIVLWTFRNELKYINPLKILNAK